MATTTTNPQPEALEQRVEILEREFSELRARVLALAPRDKDWRRTVGMMPDDEMTRSALELGRQWRDQANKE